MNKKILVVEDEVELNESLVDWLAGSGFEAVGVEDGGKAYDTFLAEKPDLVLLDVQLPNMNGIEIAKLIRKDFGTPIIMVTAKTDANDIIAGLEAGADDYVRKPFDMNELKARIKARLRENNLPDKVVLTLGALTLDVAGHEVRKDGARISLTPLEFNLLLTIAEDPKHTFTREELLKKVWLHKNLNDEADFKGKVDTRLVNVHIQRLRSKIEENPDDPQIVTTVRGRGYKAGTF